MDTLEPKQVGFVKWRESFDLQDGSVWMGLYSYLEALHIEKDKVNKDHYENFMLDFNYPAGRNMADWDHAFLSRKLFMILHHYAGADARKVITTSLSKCGFEAYRLLSMEYDPMTDDMVGSLFDRILTISKWSVKSVEEEHAAMRETERRIYKYEKRASTCLSDESHRMIAGMLYSNVLSATTKKYVISKPEKMFLVRDGERHSRKCKEYFSYMQEVVDELYKVEEKIHPKRMEIDAFAEKEGEDDEEVVYTHSELTAWAQEQFQWADQDQAQASSPSLDALGKGKGKSKGKGKGYGSPSQTQKGKGKGRDAKGDGGK